MFLTKPIPRLLLAGAVLTVLTSPAVDSSPVEKFPVGKLVVLNGKVVVGAVPGSLGPPEQTMELRDGRMRLRATFSSPDEESLASATAGLPSGVYFLFASSGERAAGDVEQQDIMADTGDVDGDGDTDIVVAREAHPARLLMNEAGTLIDMSDRLPQVSGFATDVEVADVNGDSLPDIFLTYNDEQNRLFINNGTASFADSTLTHLPVDSAGSQGADAGDVDGDGDIDIIVVNLGIPFEPASELNQLLINDGSGHFTDGTADRFLFEPKYDISMDAMIADLDGQDGPDIVIVNDNVNGDAPRLLLNTGTGHFSDVTLQRFPDRDGSCARVSAGDVDGDTMLDLYIANYFYETNFLWMNDGTGTFFDESSLRTPVDSPVDSSWSWGCALADIDDDTDTDIVFGNYPVFGDSAYEGRGQNRLLVNDGFGFFSDRTFQVFPQLEDSTYDVDFFDLNGNDYVDLFVTNFGEENLLYIDPGEDVGIGGEGNVHRLPRTTVLYQNYPNPFNPQTTIRFDIPGAEGADTWVVLDIFDIKGRLVRTLVRGVMPAGTHRTTWNGRDARGMKVASGVYIARIRVGTEDRRIKMTLLQ